LHPFRVRNALRASSRAGCCHRASSRTRRSRWGASWGAEPAYVHWARGAERGGVMVPTMRDAFVANEWRLARSVAVGSCGCGAPQAARGNDEWASIPRIEVVGPPEAPAVPLQAGQVNVLVLWCRERGDTLWIPSVLRRGRYEKDQTRVASRRGFVCEGGGVQSLMWCGTGRGRRCNFASGEGVLSGCGCPSHVASIDAPVGRESRAVSRSTHVGVARRAWAGGT
jgi:hypothetical protein